MVPGAVGHNNPEDHAAFLSGRDGRPTARMVRGGIRNLDDSAAGALDVRFAPESGHRAARLVCLLCAKSGHSHCSKTHGLQTQDLSEILEWRFHSALFLACDGRLLQVELALDAPARLVGNFALAQQPVDEFTLGGNQVGSEFPDSRSSFEPL